MLAVPSRQKAPFAREAIGVLILKIKLVCHVSFVLVLSCLATAQVPCRPTILPKATLFTNWPQYRFDAGHTRCTPYETTLSTATVGGLALDWMYRAFAQVFGDPVIANGLVYFTSLSPDQTLYAVNATTGALGGTIRVGKPDSVRPS